MSKSKFSILALVLALSMSSNSYAGAGSWTSPATITAVEIHDNAYFLIRTATTEATSANCPSNNGHYWWPATDALADQTYATTLAAFSSGRQITVVYADECNIHAKRLTNLIVYE